MIGGPPDRLNVRHERMAHLELMGKTPAEMAEVLGYCINRIYQIRRADCYQEKLAELKRKLEAFLLSRTVDLNVRLQVESHAALDTLREILTDPSKPAAARLRAAVEVLDRAPNAPKRQKWGQAPTERGNRKILVPTLSRLKGQS